ncbi:hypothetical protein Tco_0995068 [Tanacetum coccineum]
MADHSQKWHDGTSSRSIGSNSNTDGLAAIVNKMSSQQGSQGAEEVKYGEFGRPAPFNGSNGANFRVGPPGYYSLTYNHPPYEKRHSLEELMNKHQEESTKGAPKWKNGYKKLQENAEINNRNQSTSFKNLETQIEKLTKELHSRTTNGAPSPSTGQCKVVCADHEMPVNPISSRELNNLHRVSFLSDSYF